TMPVEHKHPLAHKKKPWSESIAFLSSVRRSELLRKLGRPVHPHHAHGAHEHPASKW
ncbi:hypothetical protein Tco_0563132, partial [Tanacetum coccineum]